MIIPSGLVFSLASPMDVDKSSVLVQWLPAGWIFAFADREII